MMHNEIYEAEVGVKAVLCTKQILLKDLMGMQAGDVIPIDMPENAVMYTEGVPTFMVKVGQSNDKYALKVSDVLVSANNTKR